MRRFVITWAFALPLLFAASPRVALANCPDSTDCNPAETADVPATDADGDVILFVQEVDAPEPGTTLVDGNPY